MKQITQRRKDFLFLGVFAPLREIYSYGYRQNVVDAVALEAKIYFRIADKKNLTDFSCLFRKLFSNAYLTWPKRWASVKQRSCFFNILMEDRV